MPITAQQLLQILPNAGKQAGVFAPVLNTAKQRLQIVGVKRVAAFIAQIGKAAARAAMVLADVLKRADQRAGDLAEVADQARGRGMTCEQAYDGIAK
ncbi:hypothetical protein CES87_28095 [Pseudomonas sp. ERMR1:02]|nr:hypothetical protein CES87_28095 [Pseudomonas sp. ERMR1:02]